MASRSDCYGREDPWTAAMRRGEFAAAWHICDEVLERRIASGEDCSRWPRHLQFLWDGAPLDGKRVLVSCYHGLGDTIQFVRLLPLLKPRVAEIALWAQPTLLELLRSIDGIDRLLPLHDGPPPVDEANVELMELPHLLRLNLADIPCRVPYINVPPDHAGFRDSAPRTGRAAHVGIVWSAGNWNPTRSPPLASLRALAGVGNVCWYSLQYPPAQPPFPMMDLSCRDIVAMAARLQQLDLLLTVDTMAAHLAGALGVPVWLLLHHSPDWRWMSEAENSPWYPTMRMFRQRDGDWDRVIAEVREALTVLIRAIPARDTRSSGCRASSG